MRPRVRPSLPAGAKHAPMRRLPRTLAVVTLGGCSAQVVESDAGDRQELHGDADDLLGAALG